MGMRVTMGPWALWRDVLGFFFSFDAAGDWLGHWTWFVLPHFAHLGGAMEYKFICDWANRRYSSVMLLSASLLEASDRLVKDL